ncbi:hypothetical protein [Dietzia timorensis]|uniref:hypothetical protein n=1 Tax=Dietzia timorensis TaxID=499555 RepID=UPI0012E78CCF|nr:hypothetical protein [Dietzia timorensis]
MKSGRRWLPWKSRTRSLTSRAWDWAPDWGTTVGDGPISSIISAVLFIVTFPFMIPALLITPFFLLESLLQWIVFPFAVALRLIGAIPVVAWVKVGDQAPYEERVHGWRRAKARSAELADLARANPSMATTSAATMSSVDDPYQYGPR